MKTFCVLLARQAYTEVTAIVETGWGVTKASIFQQALVELQDALNEIFALEIYTHRQTTALCFTAAGETIDIICGAIYTILPSAEIIEIPDFTYDFNETDQIATTEVKLTRDDIYPLNDFNSIPRDSMDSILNVLSRFPAEGKFIVQFVLKPVRDTSYLHFNVKGRLTRDRIMQLFRTKYWFKRNVYEEVHEKVMTKAKGPFFKFNMRMAAIMPGTHESETPSEEVFQMMKNSRNLQEYILAMMGGFSALNHPDLNSFKAGPIRDGAKWMQKFQDRDLSAAPQLTPVELTTLWHPPHVADGQNLAILLSRKGNAPQNLPTDPRDPNICFFGHTDYREKKIPFGIKRHDRKRHAYIIGKSGTGKSKLIQLLAKNDIDNGFGCAILDPHGDLIDEVLKLIPQHRINDVVLFDPSDLNFPPSFNPLVQVPNELKMRVTIGFIEIFKKIFSSNWSDRMEHVLRYSILALLSTPGATLLSIRKMLIDEEYREVIIQNVQDKVVKNFWKNEYPTWQEQYDAGVISPLLNKVGQFVATDMIRNIVGQPVNKFDFREFMDQRKIVLMKVSKGILGDDNASLLGSMVVSRIYQAAMSRADIPLEEREDFYFYVDEFHTFATSSFDEILSESRKYGLNLTVANQFLGQLPEHVKKTVFGNVGSILSMGVGGEDASILEHEFTPRFDATDLINLDVRNFYIKMAIDGETQEAFSGRTLDIDYPVVNYADECLGASREKYSRPLEEVIEMLQLWESAA